MEENFAIFKEACTALYEAGIDHVLMGGIAVWAYGRKRYTKDVDYLVRPEDADRALDALSEAGFRTERTDPKWLYKAFKGDTMIDIIFVVKGDIVLDDEMLEHAEEIEIEGYGFCVISPEDLVIIKALAIKETRPRDWYDAFSVLEGAHGKLDWDYLLMRAKKNPERVLSLLLFAHTESGFERYVPRWVLSQLVETSLLLPQEIYPSS